VCEREKGKKEFEESVRERERESSEEELEKKVECCVFVLECLS